MVIYRRNARCLRGRVVALTTPVVGAIATTCFRILATRKDHTSTWTYTINPPLLNTGLINFSRRKSMDIQACSELDSGGLWAAPIVTFNIA